MNESFATMETQLVILNDTGCTVEDVLGDGNCLFAATSHQLYGFQVGTEMHRAMTATIRELVIQFLRTNVNKFDIRLLIDDHIKESYEELMRLPYETAAEKFLEILAQDKIWGAEESLTAIARIFQCDVETMHEMGPKMDDILWQNTIEDNPTGIPRQITEFEPLHQLR